MNFKLFVEEFDKSKSFSEIFFKPYGNKAMESGIVYQPEFARSSSDS